MKVTVFVKNTLLGAVNFYNFCLISLVLLFYIKTLATQFWYFIIHYGFLLFHRDLLQYCAALSLEKLSEHFV